MFKDNVKLNHHPREVGIEELPQLSSGGVDDALTALIEVEIFVEDPETYGFPGAFVEENLEVKSSSKGKLCQEFMPIRVANTIPQDYGPSYEPLSKNVDEVAVPHNLNELRICSHQVLVSSPLVEELAVENIARRILLGCLTDWLHSQDT